MSHAYCTLPSFRLLECLVDGDAVTIDGLPYALVGQPGALSRLAHAGRVTVLVDQDDIEVVLVRSPHDGNLLRLACMSCRAVRLAELEHYFAADPAGDADHTRATSEMPRAA